MKLTRLKKANDYDVAEWLRKNIPELTVYQKERLNREFVNDMPFEMYQSKKQPKVSIWWRLTIFFVLPYIICMYIFCLWNWLSKGSWGIGQKFLNKYHYPWMAKLGLD